MRALRVLSKYRRARNTPPTGAHVNTPTDGTQVFRLPDDILYEIYEWAAIVYPPKNYVASLPTVRAQALARLGWIVLTHICRHWRAIGLSSHLAPLWARVVCFSPHWRALREVPLRAMTCPLIVDLSFDDPLRSTEMTQSGWALPTPMERFAIQNIERTQTLIAPGRRLVDKLKTRRLTLPTLRELRFGPNGLPADFEPQWELPALEVLSLPWTEGLFPPTMVPASLRELHLSVYAGRISLADLRAFLLACSHLEDLDLSVSGEWTDHVLTDDVWPAELQPVHFDHLKRARALCDEERSAADLWALMCGSPESSMKFTFWDGDDPYKTPSSAQVLMDACKSHLLSALYDTVGIRISNAMGESDLILRLSSSRTPTAFCELATLANEALRREFLSILPTYTLDSASHITSLHLDQVVVGEAAVIEVVGDLFRALKCVEELTLTGMNPWYSAKHLRVLASNAPRTVLPALTTLTISSMHIDFRLGNPIGQAGPWWSTLASVLYARCNALGFLPLRLVKLEGIWSGRGSWGRTEDRFMENLRTEGSVDELRDERVWTI
ncbi:unnamed protein product [Peniophora sp. CBMAI 1063]|nr:unnamed protein product [Peniophora sp. CBMAI 1063]